MSSSEPWKSHNVVQHVAVFGGFLHGWKYLLVWNIWNCLFMDQNGWILVTSYSST